MAQSQEELVQVTQELIPLLGFMINWEKSVLTPCQEIVFLGFLVNSLEMVFRLPEEKLQIIIVDYRSFEGRRQHW